MMLTMKWWMLMLAVVYWKLMAYQTHRFSFKFELMIFAIHCLFHLLIISEGGK